MYQRCRRDYDISRSKGRDFRGSSLPPCQQHWLAKWLSRSRKMLMFSQSGGALKTVRFATLRHSALLGSPKQVTLGHSGILHL